MCKLKENDTTWLFEEKYQPGVAFDPLFTWKNWRNFNPSFLVGSCQPELDKGYPAMGTDPAWLLFSGDVTACKHFTTKGLTVTVIQSRVKSNKYEPKLQFSGTFMNL